jgi:Holliday junction resolvase RusA-like endonuclease
MNGIVFKDDKQVCEVTVRKRYAITARAVVNVQKLWGRE